MSSLIRLCVGLIVTALTAFITHAADIDGSSLSESNEAPQLMVRFATDAFEGLTAEAALDLLKSDTADSEAQALHARSGNPKSARYLISTRLAPEYRQYLAKDDPAELLHHWLVLEYPSLEASRAAKEAMNRDPSFLQVAQDYYLDFSVTLPNDPYYNYRNYIPGTSTYGTRQKDRYTQLNIPSAWDLVKGHAYVAVADNGIQTDHPDLTDRPGAVGNLRPHLSKNVRDNNSDIDEFLASGVSKGHGTHVSGLVSAQGNNNTGTSGVCWNCSLLVYRISGTGGSGVSAVTNAINEAVWTGAQAINLSSGLRVNNAPATCSTAPTVCTAIDLATNHQIPLAAASGNIPDGAAVTQFPANHPSAFSVGSIDSSGNRSYFSATGKVDFMAPGDKIFSTFYRNFEWSPYGLDNNPAYKCVKQSSSSPLYEYGYCTGTSMSTPILTGSVALLRSANPLMTNEQTKARLIDGASNPSGNNTNIGYGYPNVYTSVYNTLYGAGGNGGVTPLFSFYNDTALNHFYTSVPQMAAAALCGTLKHGQPATGASGIYRGIGYVIGGYSEFSGACLPWWISMPQASVKIFTTPSRYGQPLVPLYRMSWTDGTGAHVSHVYTTEQAGIDEFKTVDYVVDGIEGYLYPRTIAQPAGTVRLYRMYNPVRDDYGLFPEDEYGTYYNDGYTVSVGNDWIGYVCSNSGTPSGVCL